ncbi:cobalamin B12-binding domain-containing protein [candidate division KSB1 bacterium]|nr:cobalamin B12-binding domain-containing protein [bacterium]NUM63813.1 cobalamin B12-binding domain-containing protein [candidate division KSB1 bacterium]
MERKIRVLVGKLGLDGHDRGAKIIASALRDAGFEVIYSGLHQTPEMIVEAALQEDVEVIGISMLSGAHMTLFPRVLELMKKNDMSDVLLLAGGTIPPDDAAELERQGITRVFGPGTDTRDIIALIRDWAAKRN